MRALTDYIGGLALVGGDHDGQPFTVLPWQSRFIRGTFRQAGDSALSVGRGNGKSALCAAVACAVADPAGPLHGRRREVVVVASSFAQGRIIFEDSLGFLAERYDLSDRSEWRRQDSANVATLEHRPSGARIRCLGSDPSRAHGIRPSLVLADEPAQWPSATADKMLAAVRTSLGKTPRSRLIALGTRPADPGHWFAAMLSGGAGYSQTHAARPGDPPFQRRTWARANPSLAHLPSLAEQIASEASDARRDPGLLAQFAALRLNAGTPDVETTPLLDAALWLSIEGAAPMAGPVAWGVDLGTSASQSAVAAYWPATGALAVLAAFPEVPDLHERGRRDGVAGLYGECHRRGELLTLGRRTVPVDGLLRVALARFGRPSIVAADRWRQGELEDCLEAARIPAAAFVARGMGYFHGGEDCRAFRRACADGRVTPAPSLLLRSAMAEARTVSDPAGNAKLAKAGAGGRRARARDDAAAAAILAVAVGSRAHAQRPQPRRLRSALAG